MSLSRLLSCKYARSYHQPLPLSLTPRTIDTTCCGTYCCIQGYECRSGTCVNLVSVFDGPWVVSTPHRFQAASSLSVQSVASVASVEVERSRSLESVRSQSSSMATEAPYGTGNSNNVALIGGVVGGVVGVIVLGLFGIFWWKHKRGSPVPPSATQQSFFGKQPSSQPITPASATFSTNTSYLSGPPVTYAPQPGWHLQQPTVPQGARAGGQPSAASQQSAPLSHTVNTWIDRPSTIHQENYGGYASQSQYRGSQPRLSPSSPAEAPVDPKELYSAAVRGSTHSILAPSNIPSSSEASGSAPPAYPFAPPAPERAVPWKI